MICWCSVLEDDPETDKVLLFWSPEVCIADSTPDDSLAKIMSATTHVREHSFPDSIGYLCTCIHRSTNDRGSLLATSSFMSQNGEKNTAEVSITSSLK